MAQATTRLRLRVAPGGRRTAVVGRHGDAWKLRVAAPPEHGRANEAVLRLLADTLAVPQSALTLVSGHTARDKIVRLDGVAAARVEERLSAAAAADAERKDRGS